MSHAILTLFATGQKLRVLISLVRKRLCWWMLDYFARIHVVTVQVFPKMILLLKTTDLPAGGLHNPVFGFKATYVALSWLLAWQIWLALQKWKQNVIFWGFYITFDSYIKLYIKFSSIFTHLHAWYTKCDFFFLKMNEDLKLSSFKTKKVSCINYSCCLFLFGFCSVNWLTHKIHKTDLFMKY